MSDEMKHAYNRLAATYDANRGLFDMSDIFRGFFSLLGKQQGHLLDLGCGAGEPIPGYFLEKGWQVSGIDPLEIGGETFLWVTVGKPGEIKTKNQQFMGFKTP